LFVPSRRIDYLHTHIHPFADQGQILRAKIDPLYILACQTLPWSVYIVAMRDEKPQIYHDFDQFLKFRDPSTHSFTDQGQIWNERVSPLFIHSRRISRQISICHRPYGEKHKHDQILNFGGSCIHPLIRHRQIWLTRVHSRYMFPCHVSPGSVYCIAVQGKTLKFDRIFNFILWWRHLAA